MEDRHFALLVIGFGKGGKTLAAAMGRLGKRVAMVEQSAEMYGGTCINIGCVPTKALVHRAEHPGAGSPAEWHRQAVDETRALTTALRGKNFAMLDTIDSVVVITGRAEFLDDRTVRVTAGEDVLDLTADTIVINTGAVPTVPPIPGLRESAHLRTSTGLIDLDHLPNRLAILGGGYVGVEFASIYAQFGSAVTVLDAGPRIMPREDDDVAEAAAGILQGAGVELVPDARVTAVRDLDNGVEITYEAGGRTHVLAADDVLAATGRTPATAGLGLDRAGVRTTPSGAVEVDEFLRTSRPHVYAVGDVNGGPQFTYISLDDSRIVADQLTGRGKRSTADRRFVPYTVFMSPALARVGLTEREAVERGLPVKVVRKAVADIAAMPRAKIVGETRGLMKFVVDRVTDEVLGAALLSVDAQELVNLVTLAMRHGVTASELRDAVYTHPSSTEAFNEVLATPGKEY
ncbi:pyridine nucleotide-disulfide oxidoreductase [Amycolatopsis sp. NBRC 101858]|uniref:FAD-dependent oxidoreductase n=1 Tax=Amycolatopsis sp. NBRC 101858 TaxID=3032200 RepID=UPI0024A555F7|nr:FAD-dependent oxidoreductase [Amycolatopsis sp. NBRC 101858]GLY41884.1 pyridine nucleotide-disulfide oxidoreductase [Amycolatopsis sp. NBRC 101858]